MVADRVATRGIAYFFGKSAMLSYGNAWRSGKNARPPTNQAANANSGYQPGTTLGRGTCEIVRRESGPSARSMPDRMTIMGSKNAFAQTKLRRIPCFLKPIIPKGF